MRRPMRHLSQQETEGINLGPCCICETTEGVTQILCLDGRCPILGRGWGCMVCGLEAHGAVAVLCRWCHGRYNAGQVRLRFICTGHPSADGRTPAEFMTGNQQHNFAQHVSLGETFEEGS